ncbi:MAG: hypothetical protein ACKVWR_21925 [Acidimicrobiales bacterium]
MFNADVRPRGELGLVVKRRGESRRGRFTRYGQATTDRVTVRAAGREWGLPVWPVRWARTVAMLARVGWDGLPHWGLDQEARAYRMKNLRLFVPAYLRFSVAAWAAFLIRLPFLCGQLRLEVTRADGRRVDLGLVGLRVVTTTGVNFIVDAFQNTTEVENLKFHGFGTGAAAEAVGNTTLTTELTTEYATDNIRPTGTTAEGASANIYQTVATLDPDAAVAITEHGIFSQAATGGGTMVDRTLFSVINLAASGDTLQATYELTFSSGG